MYLIFATVSFPFNHLRKLMKLNSQTGSLSTGVVVTGCTDGPAKLFYPPARTHSYYFHYLFKRLQYAAVISFTLQ